MKYNISLETTDGRETTYNSFSIDAKGKSELFERLDAIADVLYGNVISINIIVTPTVNNEELK